MSDFAPQHDKPYIIIRGPKEKDFVVRQGPDGQGPLLARRTAIVPIIDRKGKIKFAEKTPGNNEPRVLFVSRVKTYDDGRKEKVLECTVAPGYEDDYMLAYEAMKNEGLDEQWDYVVRYVRLWKLNPEFKGKFDTNALPDRPRILGKKMEGVDKNDVLTAPAKKRRKKAGGGEAA